VPRDLLVGEFATAHFDVTEQLDHVLRGAALDARLAPEEAVHERREQIAVFERNPDRVARDARRDAHRELAHHWISVVSL
jgi:hypothetical protein